MLGNLTNENYTKKEKGPLIRPFLCLKHYSIVNKNWVTPL